MGNFLDGTIKPGVVNGNEVINVLSCQTEGFRNGTHNSMGEKDHSCAFVCVTPKKRCQRQQQTFHAQEQKENYNSSNWPVHQLIAIALVHKN